jgi:hypothetical protein
MTRIDKIHKITSDVLGYLRKTPKKSFIFYNGEYWGLSYYVYEELHLESLRWHFPKEITQDVINFLLKGGIIKREMDEKEKAVQQALGLFIEERFFLNE